MDAELLTRNFLFFFILPPWVVAGFIDWMTHRKSDIEHTSGLKESATHMLEMIEAAIPVILGLFFHIDSLVLLLMIGAFVAHTLTGFWDVSYADKMRRISPTEQQCHAALQVLPFSVVAFALCLHWSGLTALFDGSADFSFRLQENPLSLSATVAFLAVVTVCLVVPYVEELTRCIRAQKADGVGEGQIANGFGSCSPGVPRFLPTRRFP